GCEMMIARSLAEEVIQVALSKGGDYAEVFVEHTQENNMSMSNGILDTVVSGQDFGASVRLLRGTECVYAYTNDVSRSAMLQLAKKVADAMSGIANGKEVTLVERLNVNYCATQIVPSSVKNAIKVDHMKTAYA